MAEVFLGADITGDGNLDADITPADSFVNIGGAIFTDAANVGAGTGNYNTFLSIQASPTEHGFNSDEGNPLDSTNDQIKTASTHTIQRSDLVIVTVGGIQYYEFRVDLNEANSDPNAQISLDQFKLYSSTSGTIESTAGTGGLFAQALIYNMDAGGNVSVLLSDAESSGSGRDDYAVLVPVSNFAGVSFSDYVYLYVEMGTAGVGWDTTSTFEEWNLQNAVILTGTKFEDENNNGIRDAGEDGVGGVTIFVDANLNGIFDAGEISTVTAADGTYSLYGIGTGITVRIDEVVPAGSTQTTGDYETVVIPANSALGATITVDPIGNFIPRPDYTVSKTATSITGGVGLNGLDGADSDGDIVNYSVVVTNTGNVTLTGYSIADPNSDTLTYVSGDDGDGLLEAGEAWTYSATHIVDQDELDSQGTDNTGALDSDSDTDNRVTVTTTNAGNKNADATTPLTYNPDFSVTKTATSITGGVGLNGLDGADDDGDIVNYSIVVTNTGNVTLTGYSISDPNATNLTLVSGDTDLDGDLDVGEIWNYTADHTVTQDELDSQGTDNTGALDSDGDTDNRVTVTTTEAGSKSADADTPLIYNPDFSVTKTAVSITGGQGLNGLTGADSDGDTINYTIVVTNTGNVTLTGYSISDPNATNLTLVSGDTDLDGDLDVGEIWNYTADHTVTQDELDSQGTDNTGALDSDGDTDNRVTVTTTEAGSKSADAVTPLIYTPLIDLEKLVAVDSTDGINGNFVDADSALGPQNVSIGTDVWFKVTLENTGNVTLTDVDVVDNNTTGGNPGTFFDLMLDGELTANAVTNYGATLDGDTDSDNELDVGETWTITYNQAFDAGNHVNTASVTTAEGAADNDAAHYYSLINDGPGVRTPGFWSNLGATFWDNIQLNESKRGKDCFADGELLYAVDSNHDGFINGSDSVGLLIGDYDHDGLTGASEDTLFIRLGDAKDLINASNKLVGGDGRFMLGRDMVATWLNFLAGNEIGDAADTQSPHHYLDDGIDWMQVYSGATAGGNSEVWDAFQYGPAIKTNTAAWNGTAVTDHSAAQIHAALDYYNNTGQTQAGGTIYAHDCDELAFVQALASLHFA